MFSNKPNDFNVEEFLKNITFVIPEAEIKAFRKSIFNAVNERLTEELNGANRYDSFFEKARELKKKFMACHTKLNGVAKAAQTFNQDEYCRLINTITNILKQSAQMALQPHPDGNAINDLIDKMMQNEAKSFAAIYYDAFRNFPTFPELEELKNDWNQQEASLNAMPKPTTTFEASFRDIAFDTVKAAREALDSQTLLINELNRCHEAATTRFELVRDNVRKIVNRAREQFPREQAPASNLYSANQAHTPGHFQPASQANNTVASLTQQTEAMKISSNSPPKVR